MLRNEINLMEKIYPDPEVLKFLRRREYMPAKLAVNVDHVATVREARKTYYPDPVHAAVLAELGGADGIVVHLRLDRRHIKERDVRLIREIIKTKLILEMAIDKDLIKFAKEVKPYQVTLVPERPEEITTEGGIELEDRVEEVKKAVKELNKSGIKVSLFINPDEKALELAKKTGAQIVELHTGMYAEAEEEEKRLSELTRLENAARFAKDLGFIVHAGHGLNYENIGPVAAIPEIEEFSIGHSIVSRAIFVGLKEAVKEMKELILRARS
jgi:pyridoxine 5-phosphate synthase